MIDVFLGVLIAGLLVFGGAYGLVITSKVRAKYYKNNGCDCGCDC